MDFTDIIKFFNEMAERHDTRLVLAESKLLLERLHRLVQELWVSNTSNFPQVEKPAETQTSIPLANHLVRGKEDMSLYPLSG
jgi:hypothetical protein